MKENSNVKQYYTGENRIKIFTPKIVLVIVIAIFKAFLGFSFGFFGFLLIFGIDLLIAVLLYKNNPKIPKETAIMLGVILIAGSYLTKLILRFISYYHFVEFPEYITVLSVIINICVLSITLIIYFITANNVERKEFERKEFERIKEKKKF